MSLTKNPTSMIDTTGATSGQVLTYNGSTSSWVASASMGASSLSANGYTTLPNGLIMQWGSELPID